LWLLIGELWQFLELSHGKMHFENMAIMAASFEAITNFVNETGEIPDIIRRV